MPLFILFYYFHYLFILFYFLMGVDWTFSQPSANSHRTFPECSLALSASSKLPHSTGTFFSKKTFYSNVQECLKNLSDSCRLMIWYLWDIIFCFLCDIWEELTESKSTGSYFAISVLPYEFKMFSIWSNLVQQRWNTKERRGYLFLCIFKIMW